MRLATFPDDALFQVAYLQVEVVERVSAPITVGVLDMPAGRCRDPAAGLSCPCHKYYRLGRRSKAEAGARQLECSPEASSQLTRSPRSF